MEGKAVAGTDKVEVLSMAQSHESGGSRHQDSPPDKGTLAGWTQGMGGMTDRQRKRETRNKEQDAHSEREAWLESFKGCVSLLVGMCYTWLGQVLTKLLQLS